MKKALKNFGLGLVYFFLLPIFLVIAALASVFALGVIIYYVVKGLIRFFKGDKFFKPLPEDIKVQEIKARQVELNEQQNQPQTPASPDNRVYIQQNYYQQPQPQFNQQPLNNVQQNPSPFQQPLPNQTNQQAYLNQPSQQQPIGIQNPSPQPTQISQNPLQNPSNQISQQPTFTPTENAQFIDISHDDEGGDDL